MVILPLGVQGKLASVAACGLFRHSPPAVEHAGVVGTAPAAEEEKEKSPAGVQNPDFLWLHLESLAVWYNVQRRH